MSKREQLIVEIYVQDVKQSAAFYERIGFNVIRRDHDFVELGWETSRLYLEQIPGQPAPPKTPVANIRIMVPDVDRYWKECGELKTARHETDCRSLLRSPRFHVVSPTAWACGSLPVVEAVKGAPTVARSHAINSIGKKFVGNSGA